MTNDLSFGSDHLVTILEVPLHLPAVQARRFLERELRFREVVSVKVQGNLLVVEHERIQLKNIEELDDCITDPHFVL